MSKSLKEGFWIGDRQIYPLEGRIHTPRGDVHVRPKVMEVLLCLAEETGKAVSREKLIESVWGHSFGADEALSRCISSLRQALGDSTKKPSLVQTIPKRGYRLIPPVIVASTVDKSSALEKSLTGDSLSREDIVSLAVLPFVDLPHVSG